MKKEKTEKGKKSLFRTIISPQIYYPAMIVLFILAWVAGKSKSTEDIDLAQFIGKSEQEVAESFGVQINEISMYPDENAVVVTCEDGIVSCINVSETDPEYSFEGFKYGDTFDKNVFDEKYTFYDSLEVNGETAYVYEGRNMADSLSIFVNSSGKVSQIMYMAGLSATDCLGNDDENDTIDYEESDVESSETENAEQTVFEIESIDIDYSGEYISIDGSQQLYLDLYDTIDSDGSIGNLFMYEGENLLYDTPYYVSTKEPDAFQDCYIRTYVFYDGEYPYYLGVTIQNGNEIWLDYDSENRNIDYFQKVEEGTANSSSNNSEFILPNSQTEYISEDDLYGLNAEQCRIARNEIYARHGKIFQSQDLVDYFCSTSWYMTDEGYDDSNLSQLEKDNINTIVAYEEKMGYR